MPNCKHAFAGAILLCSLLTLTSARAATAPTTTTAKTTNTAKTAKTTNTARTTKPPATTNPRQSRGTTPTSVKTGATTAALPTAVAQTTSTVVVALSGSVNVFAAASLTASLTDIAAAFEKAHPGVQVALNFAGSSTLVAQIQNGAPADVFASADTANMDKLVNVNAIDAAPTVFTRNKLMIVVPKGNPLRVKTLADLARPEVVVALGAPGVPVGDYARQILTKAGIAVTPKTLEANVSAIVNKAALREIDAGIVYVTDVAIDDYRVDGVAIADDRNVLASYPVAVLASSRNKPAATEFVSFTQSSPAQAILAKYKFLPVK